MHAGSQLTSTESNSTCVWGLCDWQFFALAPISNLAPKVCCHPEKMMSCDQTINPSELSNHIQWRWAF